MRKLYKLLAVILIATSANAQQLPLYSTYFFTPYIFNPAMSGYNGVTEIVAMHKRQWTGVQGAPNTSALAINGDLNEMKFGWSVYGYNDQTDIVNRTAFYGSYAYHLRFTEKNSLSFGLSAGYLNNSIDQSAINGDDGDPVIGANLNNSGQFDINFGLALKLGDFLLGASVPQLLAPKIKFSGNDENNQVFYQMLRHYVIHTQYDVRLQNDKMILSPYIVMRAADDVQPQVDAGLMFNMPDYFFVGAAYRSNYAVTANVGVHMTENISLGYAYDFSTSEFASSLGGSHELMLRWRFGSSKKDKRLENEIKKLKDKQNRQSEQTEEIVNERLDEFKDEIRRENAKTKEEQKKEIINEIMVLYDPNDPNNQNRNQNQNTNQNNQPNNNGNVVVPTTNNNNNRNQVPSNTNSNIKGYDNSSYPANVQAGSRGYYVTAGVFGSQNNARKLMRRLQDQNIDVSMFQDSGNGMYYVFVMKFNSYEQARQAKDSGLNGQYNGKLWIKVVE